MPTDLTRMPRINTMVIVVVHQCTMVYNGVQWCTMVYISVQWCTMVYNGVHVIHGIRIGIVYINCYVYQFGNQFVTTLIRHVYNIRLYIYIYK